MRKWDASTGVLTLTFRAESSKIDRHTQLQNATMIFLFSRLARWVFFTWFVITSSLYQREASPTQALSPPHSLNQARDLKEITKQVWTRLGNELYQIGNVRVVTHLHVVTHLPLYSMIYSLAQARVDDQQIQSKWDQVFNFLSQLQNSELMEVVRAFGENVIPLWRLPGTLVLDRKQKESILILGKEDVSSTLAAILAGRKESGWKEPNPDSRWQFLADQNLVGFVAEGQLFVGLSPPFQTFEELTPPLLSSPAVGNTHIPSIPSFVPVERVVWLKDPGAPRQSLEDTLLDGASAPASPLAYKLIAAIGSLSRSEILVSENADIPWIEANVVPYLALEAVPPISPLKVSKRIAKPPASQKTFTSAADALRYLLTNPDPSLSLRQRMVDLGRQGRLLDAKGIPLTVYGAASSYRFILHDLEQFFADVPKEEVTLATLQSAFSTPPKPFKKEPALISLLKKGRPKDLTWRQFLRLSEVAYSDYRGILKEAIQRFAHFLDHPDNPPPRGYRNPAQSYYQDHAEELATLARERYFEKLPSKEDAELIGLTIALLEVVEEDKFPRGRQGRPKKEGEKGLSIEGFLLYFPPIASEHFRDWIQEWKKNGRLSILSSAQAFTPFDALRHLLNEPNPEGLSFFDRMVHLARQGRIVYEAGGQPISIKGIAPAFLSTCQALEQFFRGMPKEKMNLETLQDVIQKPPKRLTKVTILKTLLENEDKKPDSLTGWQFIHLWPVGYQDYEEIVDTYVKAFLKTLDNLDEAPKSYRKTTLEYFKNHGSELRALSDEHYFKLLDAKAGESATLTGLTISLLDLAQERKLPASKGEFLSGDGFVRYFPTLASEYFVKWVEEWNKRTTQPPGSGTKPKAQKFSTREEALRYLLENPDPEHSFADRIEKLSDEDRLVNAEGKPLTVNLVVRDYRPMAILLDELQGVRRGEITLELFQRFFQKPSEPLSKAKTLFSLLKMVKPAVLSWEEYLRLLPIAYPEYQKFIDQSVVNVMKFLVDPDHPSKMLKEKAKDYAQRYGTELFKLAQEHYFDKLQGKPARLIELTIVMLTLAEEGTLHGPISFIESYPTLAHDYFLKWIQKWKQTEGLTISSSLTKEPRQLLQEAINQLVALGPDGVYQGLTESRKVSEIVEDDAGQFWIYEQVFGKDQLRGRNLNDFHKMIAEELTREGGFLGNWNPPDMTYEYMPAYLEFVKHYRESELAIEKEPSPVAAPQDQPTVVLSLTKKGVPYKWSRVHEDCMKQINAGKRVRLPKNLWAKTGMGNGEVVDTYVNLSETLHVLIKDEVHPFALSADISIFIPKETSGKKSKSSKSDALIAISL